MQPPDIEKGQRCTSSGEPRRGEQCMNRFDKMSWWVGGSMAALGLAAPAAAQTGAPQPTGPAAAPTTAQPAPDDSGGLEEILVTARRRAENLQETPVSITAFSGERLQDLNVQDLPRLAEFTPGLQLTSLPGSAGIAVSIRGISVSDPILTNDPSIGLYVDGVYQNPLGSGKADLLDLEQVQVLRGPQGTLFGRNTTGGAILITTRRPTPDFGVETLFHYGNQNDLLTRTSLNTGDVLPGWRAMLTYQFRQNDGWVDNLDAPSDRDPGASRSHSFRAAVHGEIGRLMLDYTYSMVRRRDTPPHLQTFQISNLYAQFAAQSPARGGDILRVSQAPLKATRLPVIRPNKGDTDDHLVTLSYEFSRALTVKSITGWRKFTNSEVYLFGSTAGLALPITDLTDFSTSIQVLMPSRAGQERQYTQFTQELQLTGSLPRIDYAAGLYYYNSHYGEYQPQQYPIIFPIPGVGTIVLDGRGLLDYQGQTRSYAAFGQVSYTPPVLDDDLEVTVGIRYTKDEKDVTNLAPVVDTRRSRFDNASYNLTLSYELMPDVRGYVRYGTGYRAGGLNARGFGGAPYKPETAKVYEAGLKAEFLDRRVRTNLAVYRTDYKDFQAGTQRVDPVAGYVTDTVNAGRAHYTGFEAEVTVAPVRGLILSADAAYVDPVFDEFILNGIDVSRDAKFIYQSNWQWHVGGSYDFPETSLGKVRLSADYGYKSRRYFFTFTSDPVLLPNARENARGEPQKDLSARLALVDIPIGLRTAEIALYGQNLTNARYKTTGVDFGALGFVGGAFNRPRTYGIEARLAF
jgi:iron complex outermembrane receptor protein